MDFEVVHTADYLTAVERTADYLPVVERTADYLPVVERTAEAVHKDLVVHTLGSAPAALCFEQVVLPVAVLPEAGFRILHRIYFPLNFLIHNLNKSF